MAIAIMNIIDAVVNNILRLQQDLNTTFYDSVTLIDFLSV